MPCAADDHTGDDMSATRIAAAVATGTLALGLAAAPARAEADSGAGSKACLEDVKYLVRAHRGNLAEQAAGQAALAESTDERVHWIARMLVRDHGVHDDHVVTHATAHQVTLPPKPNRKQRDDLAAVVAQSGPEFDLAWLRLQEAAHVMTLDHIGRELRDGCATDVRWVAAAARGPVQMHLAATRAALRALQSE